MEREKEKRSGKRRDSLLQPMDQLPSSISSLSQFQLSEKRRAKPRNQRFFIVSLQWSTSCALYTVILPLAVSSCKKLTKTVLAIVAHRWRKKKHLFARRDAFCPFPESCLFLSWVDKAHLLYVSAYIYSLYIYFWDFKNDFFKKKIEMLDIRIEVIKYNKWLKKNDWLCWLYFRFVYILFLECFVINASEIY